MYECLCYCSEMHFAMQNNEKAKGDFKLLFLLMVVRIQ